MEEVKMKICRLADKHKIIPLLRKINSFLDVRIFFDNDIMPLGIKKQIHKMLLRHKIKDVMMDIGCT
jgi:hypothetical protein